MSVRQNYDSVKVRVGESVDLMCNVNAEVKLCAIQTPQGEYRPFFEGADYDRLRRIADNSGGTATSCGAQISPVTEEDNGQWKCVISVVDADGKAATAEGDIDVVVAVPPVSVGFNAEDVPANADALTIKLDEAGTKEVRKLLGRVFRSTLIVFHNLDG